MSGFTPTCASTLGLDPRKRVDYHLGLVLGEDEFRQDQLHHRERDHHATRALHGYGTVSGLAVTYDDGQRRLHVAPGVAVDPAGHLVCVPVEHCAALDGWLRDHLEGDEVSGSPPTSLAVFVVLCWTECETDEVPIPADSCLPADESRAPSRILDSFELRLVLEPPPLVGEVAPGSPDGLADLVGELHGLLDTAGGSPPDAEGVAALLRGWAVERRPEVVAGQACLPAPDGGHCVLLARVDLDVVEGVSGPAVAGATVDDSDRPVLVSTRLLQEAMLATGADVEVPPHQHALAGLDDVDLGAGPATGDVLAYDGTSWVPGPAGGGVADHGSLTALDLDHHVQYLLADGTRPLSGDLSAAGNRLTDLPPSAADGEPVVDGQGAGGDLTGQYPDPQLGAIQGTPVDAPAPAERDVLLLREGAWRATRPLLLPLATIERRGERLTYLVWFHLDAPENRVEVEHLDEGNLIVERETDNDPFLEQVGPREVIRLARNLFQVHVEDESAPLRFTFLLERLPLTEGMTVREWAERLGIWFVGQSLELVEERGETVTAFHIGLPRLG